MRNSFARFRRVCGILASVTTILMMASVVPDIIGRTFFNRPITGVLEFNEILMVAIVFLGLAWTQGERGNIRVEVLVTRLSPRVQSVLALIVWSLALALWIAIAIGGAKEAAFSVSIGESYYGAARMPIWPARIAFAFGASLLSIQLLLDVVEEVLNIFRVGKKLSLTVK